MMLHDIFGSKQGIGGLKAIINKFPNSSKFIFADTVKSKSSYSNIFTAGFELVHALQHQELFTLDYYKKAFRDCHLIVNKQIALDVPNTYLFILSKE